MRAFETTFRKCWILGGIVLCGAMVAIPAQEKSAPPRKRADGGGEAREDRAASLQAEVERRYLRLQSMMAKLAAAAKEAEDEDSTEKKGRLGTAIERSGELKVVARLRSIQALLVAKQLRDALEEEKLAERDLERILRILRGEDEAETLKDEARKVEELRDELERLEKLAQDEEKALEETRNLDEEGRSSADPEAKAQGDQLSKKQRAIERRAEELRRALERAEEKARRESGSQGEESQQGQDGQQGQQGQEGKQGKQGQQGQEGKQGQEAKQGQQKQQSPSRSASARARASQALRRAAEKMAGASSRLDSQNLKGAEEDQEEALAELNKAAEELEEKLAEDEEQTREDVIRQLVAKLVAMLAEQELVSAETREADAGKKKAAAGNPSAAPDPAATPDAAGGEEQGSTHETRSLARRERALHTDAGDASRILEADDTSVVVPPILERIQEDLENAAGLLDGGETGPVTQLVQQEIETALRELIEALKPRPKEPGPLRESLPRMMRMKGKPILSPIAELRMLKAAQRRVRERTEKLAALGLIKTAVEKEAEAPAASPEAKAVEAPEPAERPANPLADQARRAAEAEEKLAGLTATLIERFPFIDDLLLGKDNDLTAGDLGLPSSDGDEEKKAAPGKAGEEENQEKENKKETEKEKERETEKKENTEEKAEREAEAEGSKKDGGGERSAE